MNKKSLNKRIFERIEKELNSNRLYIVDKNYQDGYFDMNKKDAQITFKIKGLKSWLFGCTIEQVDKDNIKIEIFTQFERFIDKFNAYHSTFILEGDMNDTEGKFKVDDDRDLIYLANETSKMIKYIKHHPVKAFYIDTEVYSNVWDNESFKAIKMFYEIYKDKYNHFKNRFIYWYIQKKLRSLAKRNKIKAVYEKDNWNTNSNEDFKHVNDYYYIYTEDEKLYNKIENVSTKLKEDYYLCLDNLYLSKNIIEFYLDICQECVDKKIEDLSLKEQMELLDDLLEEYYKPEKGSRLARRKKNLEELSLLNDYDKSLNDFKR
jgi:hypothetical protein